MRKLFVSVFAVAMAMTASVSVAQQMPPIPVDGEVRIGKLDNGLTYYIRHNDFNKDRADFYIAQKVGSILEEDDQRGLAHFLEHMCFNGTENFKGNDMISYLETIGVKFGVNLNAYTSVDETVYNISDVPVVRESIIDSCLLILHDWADGLTLDPEEIDKERGVIHEEWRTRTGAMMRMYEKSFPEIYPGSKYAYRLPIGTMEVVDNFPYQVLRDYYEKWYRPDQQGIVVVGDIDVDQVEAKIKEIFSPIEMPADAAERTYFPVPDNREMIVTVQKDKEQQNYQIEYYHKHDAFPNEAKTTMDYLLYNYMVGMAEAMINARFTEMMMKPDVPFMYAGSSDTEYILAKTKEAFTTFAITDADGLDASLASIVREVERVRRHGFTAGEYDRARSEYLSMMEKAYNNRDKQKNEYYVNQYVRHFIDNEPIPSMEDEYNIMKQTVGMIPVEAVNQLIPVLIADTNVVVAVYCPDKEGMRIPTKDEIANVVNQTAAEDIEPYVDTTPTEPLMTDAEMPKGGSIKSETDGEFGTRVLTLSNGIKVVLKDTDLKADDITMVAYSWGGKSLVADKDLLDAEQMTGLVQLGGLGKFSMVDLQKVLSGKQASVSPNLGRLTESFSGHSTVKDFETMLQLLYLSFGDPRKDTEAVQAQLQILKSSLANQEVNPQVAFMDSLNTMLYGGNPRFVPMLKAAMVDKINYDNTLKLYKQRFENPGDFTFIFVGNLDAPNVRELIAKYIGGLDTKKKTERYNAKNVLDFNEGRIEKAFTRQMETPKTTVIELYLGEIKYSQKASMAVDIVCELLNMRYTESIRENLGGSYGVSVYGVVDDLPKGEFMTQIYFDTDPERCDTVISVVRKEIDDFIANGPNAEDLAKVKEYKVKSHNENLKENGYWLNVIYTNLLTGRDDHKDYLKTLESIDDAYLVKIAKHIFDENNKKQLIMTGVN